MKKNLQILVFGKAGCQKCKVLNGRLDDLLAKPEWKEFEKRYIDVETEDGMVEFCQMECLNPQRIPAFVVTQSDEQGREKPLPNRQAGEVDKVCGNSKLYQFLGVQTDYSAGGRGVITPKMIQSILYEAKEQAS